MHSDGDLAILLGKSERRIRERAKEGKIPGCKIGIEMVFQREIDRWLSERKETSVTTVQPESQQEPQMPFAQAPGYADPEPMEW